MTVARIGGFAMRQILRQPSELGTASVMLLTRKGSYNIAKAQAMLGYKPQIRLAEGMKRTQDWLRNQGIIS